MIDTNGWFLWITIQDALSDQLQAALGWRYRVFIVASASIHPESVYIRLLFNDDLVYSIALPYEIQRKHGETDFEVQTRLTRSLFATLSEFDGGEAKRKFVQPVSRVYGLASIIDGHGE